jgi:hypothetical protein
MSYLNVRRAKHRELYNLIQDSFESRARQQRHREALHFWLTAPLTYQLFHGDTFTGLKMTATPRQMLVKNIKYQKEHIAALDAGNAAHRMREWRVAKKKAK